jgi:hypothetical protein
VPLLVYVCSVCGEPFIARMVCQKGDEAFRARKLPPCKIRTTFNKERICRDHPEEGAAAGSPPEDRGIIWMCQSFLNMSDEGESVPHITDPLETTDGWFLHCFEKRYGVSYTDIQDPRGKLAHFRQTVMNKVRTEFAVWRARKYAQKRRDSSSKEEAKRHADSQASMHKLLMAASPEEDISARYFMATQCMADRAQREAEAEANRYTPDSSPSTPEPEEMPEVPAGEVQRDIEYRPGPRAASAAQNIASYRRRGKGPEEEEETQPGFQRGECSRSNQLGGFWRVMWRSLWWVGGSCGVLLVVLWKGERGALLHLTHF